MKTTNFHFTAGFRHANRIWFCDMPTGFDFVVRIINSNWISTTDLLQLLSYISIRSQLFLFDFRRSWLSTFKAWATGTASLSQISAGRARNEQPDNNLPRKWKGSKDGVQWNRRAFWNVYTVWSRKKPVFMIYNAKLQLRTRIQP